MNLKSGSAQLHNIFKMNKLEGENSVSAIIKSTAIGLLKFQCTGLTFDAPKEIALFNSATNQWEWQTESFDEGSFFRFDKNES
jgi:hypothetical protein